MSTVGEQERRKGTHRLNSRHFGFAGETLHGTVCVFIFVVVFVFFNFSVRRCQTCTVWTAGCFFFVFLECMKEIQCDFYLSNTKNEEGCFWVS